MPESFIRSMQEAVVGQLKSCAAIGATSVYSRLDGNVDTKIATALSVVGISIFVSPPAPISIDSDTPGPAGTWETTVRVIETPISNRSGLDASFLAEVVMRRLQGWAVPLPGAGLMTLSPDPFSDHSHGDRVVFDYAFQCPGVLQEGID